MELLDIEASDNDILGAVGEWVSLLAAERYQEAYDFLYHPDNDSWSPEATRTVINNFDSDAPHWSGTIFRVTLPETATQDFPPRHDVHRSDNIEPERGCVGYVWYDLPLNGKWSDLTATLDIVPFANALVLVAVAI